MHYRRMIVRCCSFRERRREQGTFHEARFTEGIHNVRFMDVSRSTFHGARFTEIVHVDVHE